MHRKLFKLIHKKNKEPEEKKPNCFEKLPDDILKRNLFGLTGLGGTAIAFVKTSKRHHQLFQIQIDLPSFILLVAYGKQDEAEAILQKYYAQKDEETLHYLLTNKSDVTDFGLKEFEKITAFQYALWALDQHMWEMLLKYLPRNEAISQLKELEEKGLTYTKPAFGNQIEKRISKEKHFDFSPLIAALEDCVYNFDTRSASQRQTAWCTNVGDTQRNIPAHVAQEYCRLDRSFSKATFKDLTLPRRLAHGECFTTKQGLGTKFAMRRGQTWNPYKLNYPRHGYTRAEACPEQYHIWKDLDAMTLLGKVRKAELETLKAQLLTPELKLTSSMCIS